MTGWDEERYNDLIAEQRATIAELRRDETRNERDDLRIRAKEFEAKVSDLEAQLRQEREAKDEMIAARKDRIMGLGASLKNYDDKLKASQAQVAQLQTNVGQLASAIKEYRMWHSPHVECNGCPLCANVDAALATCPAPEASQEKP